MNTKTSSPISEFVVYVIWKKKTLEIGQYSEIPYYDHLKLKHFVN